MRLLFACTLLAATAACASAPPAPLAVFKYTGSRQCEGGGTPPERMRADLEAAGIQVLATACATDGRMRVAMCGAGDGRLVILEIAPEQAEAAAKLGFEPLAKLPSAQRAECR
ncbi:MAG: hypothetical protein U1F50_21100 [Rubrivivax sp.]